MVSRKDTVNINNMPAESEEPYDPEKVQQGSGLARKLFFVKDASEWKTTRFQTTPPVRLTRFS